MSEQSATACTSQSSNHSSSETHKEVKKYSFSDEITVPANSVTTVTATSSPSIGEIPYTMTYELTPPAGMTQTLRKGMELWRFGNKVEETDRGTVLVHFPGVLVVDSGYEIVVDVIAVPIHDQKSRSIMKSQQTVYPAS